MEGSPPVTTAEIKGNRALYSETARAFRAHVRDLLLAPCHCGLGPVENHLRGCIQNSATYRVRLEQYGLRRDVAIRCGQCSATVWGRPRSRVYVWPTYPQGRPVAWCVTCVDQRHADMVTRIVLLACAHRARIPPLGRLPRDVLHLVLRRVYDVDWISHRPHPPCYMCGRAPHVSKSCIWGGSTWMRPSPTAVELKRTISPLIPDHRSRAEIKYATTMRGVSAVLETRRDTNGRYLYYNHEPTTLSWHAQPTRFCGGCSTPRTELKPPVLRCSKCHVQVYCGRECQEHDWPRHKKVCRGLERQWRKRG